MSLESALEAARQLKDSLAQEVEHAQGERVLLRSLDAAGLLARANERQSFNAHALWLQTKLAEGLGQAAAEWGVREVTWTTVRAHAPREFAFFEAVIGEIRSLAAALKQLDTLHRSLVERTLVCLRAYTQRVPARAAVYDRRGAFTQTLPARRGAWGHV